MYKSDEVKLAIVIPAYKPDFFQKALESIAAQTCKRFTVYIGDDASPFDLDKIVEPFKTQIDIVYQKFNTNLGGTNLVAQWNRCIEMVHNEEWIWLFSDDDLMSANCVDLFYKAVENYPEQKLFHFDIDIIDENDDIYHHFPPFSERMYGVEIFAGKLQSKLQSTIVEYIFKRELFVEKQGFVWFDLAWGSDDATWIKFAGNTPIVTIKNALVYWRYSKKNISGSLTDKSIIKRKLEANVEYLKWTKNYFQQYGITDPTTNFQKVKWMMQTVKEAPNLNISEKIKLCYNVTKRLNIRNVFPMGVAYLMYSDVKKNF